jgi:hypothetical protein
MKVVALICLPMNGVRPAKTWLAVDNRSFVNGNEGWTSGRKKRMNVELVLLSGRKPCFLKYL